MTCEYDPFSPTTLADPGAAYESLLAECPVHRFDGFDPGFYSLSRYDDVTAALRNVETCSSLFGQGPHKRVSGGMQSDPPQHTTFRRIVQRAFTPKAVAEGCGWPAICSGSPRLCSGASGRFRWSGRSDGSGPGQVGHDRCNRFGGVLLEGDVADVPAISQLTQIVRDRCDAADLEVGS
jgi:hypothetical protein